MRRFGRLRVALWRSHALANWRQGSKQKSSHADLSVIVSIRSDRDLWAVIKALFRAGQSVPAGAHVRGECVAIDYRRHTGGRPSIRRKVLMAAAHTRKISFVEAGGSIGRSANLAIRSACGDYIVFCPNEATLDWRPYIRMVYLAKRARADIAVNPALCNALPTRKDLLGSRSSGLVVQTENASAIDWSIYHHVVRRQYWIEAVPSLREIKFPFIEAKVRLYGRGPQIAVIDARAIGLRQAPDTVVATQTIWQTGYETGHENRELVNRYIIERSSLSLIRWALREPRDTKEYVALLLRAVWLTAGDECKRNSHVRGRLMTYLASKNRWRDADEVDCYFRDNGARPPASIVGGTVSYDSGSLSVALDGVPGSLLELGEREAKQVVEIDSAHLDSRGRFILAGWTYVRGVSMNESDPKIEVELVGVSDAVCVPLAVRSCHNELANRLGDSNADYAQGGFEATVDLIEGGRAADERLFDDRGENGGEYLVRVRLEQNGLMVEKIADRFSKSGSARLSSLMQEGASGPVFTLIKAADGRLRLSFSKSRSSPIPARRSSEDAVISVCDISMDGDQMILMVQAREGADDVGCLRLKSERADLDPISVRHVAASTWALKFELTTADWYGQRRPVAPRDFQLIMTRTAKKAGGGGRRGAQPVAQGAGTIVRASPEMMRRLPVRIANSALAAEMIIHDNGAVAISVGPPFRSDELGAFAQKRLQSEYQRMRVEPIRGILFQCYQGEFCSDSQLAIYREIRERSESIPVYWSVAGYHVPVPEGVRPLLIGSEEWFRYLAAVTYICHNSHFPSFFRKRPHQRLLQTFHGYPVKSMGRAHMERDEEFTPLRIERAIQARRAEWDAITVPSRLVAGICRQEYEYQGSLIMSGYPRNDALLSPKSSSVRDATRSRLDVAPDDVVVLYAPTWRENLKISEGRSAIFSGLDLEWLAHKLGEGFRILARGHDFNLRAGQSFGQIRNVIDVTDYPDVNDLILAADVGVFDYSSIRFDWALTRKPMVFFVPDLEQYRSSRGFLVPFEQTTPGPWTFDRRDLVRALRRFREVEHGFSAVLEEFNSKYNPLADGESARRVVDVFFADLTGSVTGDS